MLSRLPSSRTFLWSCRKQAKLLHDRLHFGDVDFSSAGDFDSDLASSAESNELVPWDLPASSLGYEPTSCRAISGQWSGCR